MEVTKETLYPDLFTRFKATLADGGVILVGMILISQLLGLVGEVSDGVRMVCFSALVLYDPLMVTFTGGTLGHRMFQLRVKRQSDHSKNIHFVAALVRFATKILLGGISLITVHTSPYRLGIHDFVTFSIVLYTPSESVRQKSSVGSGEKSD